MFDEKKIGEKIAPQDQKRFLFERRAGVRDWETGKIMPQFRKEILPILGFDEVVVDEAPLVEESPVVEDTPVVEEAPVGSVEPKRRGRKPKVV